MRLTLDRGTQPLRDLDQARKSSLRRARALFYAIAAYGDARGGRCRQRPLPASLAKVGTAEGSPSLEVTSTWDSLAPEAATLTCVPETTKEGAGPFTGAGTGFADRTGALTETLNLPVIATATTVELRTFELMTGDDEADALSLCTSVIEQKRAPDASVVLVLSR